MGACTWKIALKHKVEQSKNGKFTSNFKASPIDFETQVSCSPFLCELYPSMQTVTQSKRATTDMLIFVLKFWICMELILRVKIVVKPYLFLFASCKQSLNLGILAGGSQKVRL